MIGDEGTDACKVEEVIERYALAIFYNTTNGQGWTNDDGWLSDFGVCDAWRGIICVNNRVEEINLGKCNDFFFCLFPAKKLPLFLTFSQLDIAQREIT
jgi:hypothetical protein